MSMSKDAVDKVWKVFTVVLGVVVEKDIEYMKTTLERIERFVTQ